jgi:hypothetical protein
MKTRTFDEVCGMVGNWAIRHNFVNHGDPSRWHHKESDNNCIMVSTQKGRKHDYIAITAYQSIEDAYEHIIPRWDYFTIENIVILRRGPFNKSLFLPSYFCAVCGVEEMPYYLDNLGDFAPCCPCYDHKIDMIGVDRAVTTLLLDRYDAETCAQFIGRRDIMPLIAYNLIQLNIGPEALDYRKARWKRRFRSLLGLEPRTDKPRDISSGPFFKKTWSAFNNPE